MGPIDDPCGYDVIRAAIARKSTLKAIYREFYGYYRDRLQRCPETGAVVEIGAGRAACSGRGPDDFFGYVAEWLKYLRHVTEADVRHACGVAMQMFRDDQRENFLLFSLCFSLWRPHLALG